MRTLFVAGLLFFFSCSPKFSTFSRDIYSSYNWSDEELKKIQFYLSDDLLIYRTLSEGEKVTIRSGEIKMVDGRRVEQIRFRRNTPGVFLFRPKEDHFAISFETGNDNQYLMFGPNPKMGGKYMLLASEWDRKSGVVTYNGQKYRTESEAIPQLLVNMQSTKKRTVSNREASGRKVN